MGISAGTSVGGNNEEIFEGFPECMFGRISKGIIRKFLMDNWEDSWRNPQRIFAWPVIGNSVGILRGSTERIPVKNKRISNGIRPEVPGWNSSNNLYANSWMSYWGNLWIICFGMFLTESLRKFLKEPLSPEEFYEGILLKESIDKYLKESLQNPWLDPRSNLQRNSYFLRN